jgi:hypothetical protein
MAEPRLVRVLRGHFPAVLPLIVLLRPAGGVTGRRMADTAAHLVERVFPYAPTRQWVLSFPFALRYRLAYDKELCSAV